MPYSFGDVVLVPFPFTSQSASKKRPAVIVSTHVYNSAKPDVVVMAVTSQLVRSISNLGEVSVQKWEEAGLLKPSAIKPVFTTLEQNLIIRRLGALSDDDQKSVRQVMAQILG